MTMTLHSCVAAATALTILALSPAAPAAAHPANGAADRSGPVWGGCPPELRPHPRQQCADIRVPLDYRQPRGTQITVKMSRITATDPARRLGTLVLLPGGPGNGGLHWPADYYGDGQPPELRDRYDLVGFDARGIRYSTPITCGLDQHDRGPRYPAPDGSIDAMTTYSRRTAEACIRHSGPIIRHVTTANTARDLDRVRAALGERRISLYGLSYGTYLGAAYASMFPDRTDRVVLDSAIDPRRTWYNFTRLGAQGLADRLPDLTTWIAARHDLYGLGRTPQEVHRRYRLITAKLDANPLDDVDGNRLRRYTLDALKEPADRMFPPIADLWAALATLPAAPTANAPAGPDKHRATVGTAPTMPLDNNIAVEYAVTCGDAPWPRDVRFYRAAVRNDRQRFPDDAGRSANITPCAFWPTPLQSPVQVHDRGPRNILVVQNRRDPATPWISGLGMRRAFGDRAALITADFGGHGVIGHQRCATMVALDYLVTDARQLPGDRVCPA
jgi:pimeloyl-ACP methyl ester carboxylesterase